MADLFTGANLITLAILVLLQAVLGFDNLLYISIESQRVEEDKQAFVRRTGLLLAIVLRIALLFILVNALEHLTAPFLTLKYEGIVEGAINGHSVVVLLGGGFIIYTALKEIMHMLAVSDIDGGKEEKRSVASAMFWIVVMNLIFSFDSILSAIALTDVFMVMAAAIVISGVMMIVLAGTVSEFLKKNRMYEVLGLFILFIVGIMLVSEGGHLAHLKFAGHPIEPMAKSTFYFVLVVLVLVDIIQGRYQKKLMKQAEAERDGKPDEPAAAKA